VKRKAIAWQGIALLFVFGLADLAEAQRRPKKPRKASKQVAKPPPQRSTGSAHRKSELSARLKMMYGSQGRSSLRDLKIRGLRGGNTAVDLLSRRSSRIRDRLSSGRRGTAGMTVLGRYSNLSTHRRNFRNNANPRSSGRFEGYYVGVAKRIGANYFSTSTRRSATQKWRENRRFLDRAIARHDVFRLSTPFKNRLGRDGKGTGFSREIGYLMHRGYRPTPNGKFMVRPSTTLQTARPMLNHPGPTFKPPGM